MLHAYETTGRADKALTYVHVACTEYLTLMHVGGRSSADIDDGEVLATYTGVLVRDGYAGYDHLPALHAWCGAHLLRDLRSVSDADPIGQLWATAMADTLTAAHHAATTAEKPWTTGWTGARPGAGPAFHPNADGMTAVSDLIATQLTTTLGS